MAVWVPAGLAAGAAFSLVGTGFVVVSLFTDISRPAWLMLNNAKGIIGFGCCGVAGYLAGRRTSRAATGAAAGALGGAIAGLFVPMSMYVLAYGFIDAVRQYPFEYYDYLSSGASSVRAFLESDDGHATVRSTSLLLAPVIAAWATALGALMGYLGARLERLRPRGSVPT